MTKKIKLKKQNGEEIHFTIDGSDPTVHSAVYTEPFIIDSTTCIRAQTFVKKMLPSDIITQTYIIAETYNLPIFSITTAPRNLFNDTIGLYATGVGNPNPGNANYAKGWERPINIEYFEEGKQIFNEYAGTKIIGLFIRRFPQKGFSIHFKKRYGKSQIQYQMFKDKPTTEYKSFTLRTSGNDMGKSFIRDGMMQSLLIDQIDIDYQSYHPAILYLNGKFWGLYNLREKQNEHCCF